MSKCKHTIIQYDKCVECGKPVDSIYATETHPCSECLQFKKINTVIPSLPVCEKKLMSVTRDMHSYYKIDEGTCFESK